MQIKKLREHLRHSLAVSQRSWAPSDEFSHRLDDGQQAWAVQYLSELYAASEKGLVSSRGNWFIRGSNRRSCRIWMQHCQRNVHHIGLVRSSQASPRRQSFRKTSVRQDLPVRDLSIIATVRNRHACCSLSERNPIQTAHACCGGANRLHEASIQMTFQSPDFKQPRATEISGSRHILQAGFHSVCFFLCFCVVASVT